MFFVSLAPSDDGAFRSGEQSRYCRHGLVLAQQPDRLSAAAFQLWSASLWSHATQYNYKTSDVPLFMRNSII